MFARTPAINPAIDFAIDTKRNRNIWSLLAFQGGWINAGGFLACGRFVSHVTGFATQFGADVAHLSWKNAIGMMTVPFFFLIGSMISAFYVDRSIENKKKGQYHILFFLISFFLLLVTLMGVAGLFGTFGAALDIVSDYVMIALLCLSSGIQNASVSTATQGFVRTTHMTGLTTDLGIGFVRMMSKSQIPRAIEKQMTQVRILLIMSFIMGTTIGSLIFLRTHYIGFIFPCLSSFFIYLIARKGHLQKNA